MIGSRKIVVLVSGCAVVVALGIFLSRKHSSRVKPQSRVASSESAPGTHHLHIHARAARADSEDGETDPGDSKEKSREKVDEYLKLHHRNLASLLTAFHELDDTNFLREAATNFPNDPRLQWTILAREVFPEDRRKWLDSFKASSPSNSLANYLSAQDFFKNGHTNEALQELIAAATKPQFTDYSMETVLDSEAFGRFMGRSPSAIHQETVDTMEADEVPQLSNFKSVVKSVHEVQQQYATAGDSASVQSLAQTGVDFANRMTTGDGGKFLINQLVSFASEAIVLQALDQNASYDFLGGQTPAQWTADMKQQEAAMRDLFHNAQAVLPSLNDDQVNGYWERVKIYGELNAMRWLKEQQTVMAGSGD
jgi:hypothetical protein